MVKKVVRRTEFLKAHVFQDSGVLLIEAADNPRPVHKLRLIASSVGTGTGHPRSHRTFPLDPALGRNRAFCSMIKPAAHAFVLEARLQL
jgi:hypothetical protein